MKTGFNAFLNKNRRFLPLLATIVLFFIVYAAGAASYDGMRDPQVFLNIFRNNPYLLISAVGSTFVIISGGIDLSVGGVVALTSVASAALLRDGWNPWVVMLLMLVMGMALGCTMGAFITYLKVQPFIATLAGMWFARGMCFFISDDAIAIDNWTYTVIARTRLLIPGLSNPATQQGDYISILVIIMMLVLAAAMYIAHYTRFGRTMYAMGGNNGANEQSALLMGLPVNRTKMMVYTLNGFCSALAGIAYSITVSSGHGYYASGFELTVIAVVVIGGTMLTGGEGYVFGTLFGVLITGVIQTLIQFNGKLSSWWTSIVIGLLTLVFIGVQSFLAARKVRQAGKEAEKAEGVGVRGRRKMPAWQVALISIGALVVIAVPTIMFVRSSSNAGTNSTPVAVGCQLKPYRQDQAETLRQGGAVLVYERNGGAECIDELYAIYPDGRIVGDNTAGVIEKQITTADVDDLLSNIRDLGWFTDEFFNTWHTPCGQCYGYYLTITYQGEVKTIKAVDGGTDAPANYWQVVSVINGVIPKFVAP